MHPNAVILDLQDVIYKVVIRPYKNNGVRIYNKAVEQVRLE